MAAYILVALTIHDRDTYQRYVQAFVPAFTALGGEILALKDDPVAVEGSWPFTRLVILRMPSEEAFLAWYHSPEYQAIAQDRFKAAVANITVLPEFRLPGR
jgi:uncharacterized protein (DUF1330 family)